MDRKIVTLAAIGAVAVAAALVTRLAARRAPPTAEAGAVPAAGSVSPAATAQAGTEAPGVAAPGSPAQGDDFLLLPGAPPPPPEGAAPAGEAAARDGGDAEEEAEGEEGEGAVLPLGGFLRSARLPMCGREADVELRSAPGGETKSGTLPSCAAAYSEFPGVNLLPVGPREGEWIRIGDDWAPVDEVRSAETLIVDGREYWHDLFNATAEWSDGVVILTGDTDPCAGEVCGDGHGLWEQEQVIRERYASDHPDGIPPAVQARMEKEIAEMNAEAERSWEASQQAAARRPRVERTLRLPPGGKRSKVEASGGGYLCCT